MSLRSPWNAGGSPPRRRKPSFVRQLAVAILIVGVAGYVLLALAPGILARMIPSSWWDRLGAQAEQSFVGGARRCASPGGDEALAALVRRLTGAEGSIDSLRLTVFEMGVTNAWALPGNRIVLTRDLIERAGDADELAGVLAHEIGHIRSRHAEMQIIREIGVSALLELGSGGGMTGMLAVLRYSREAEREADAIAADLLIQADIDPQALTRFLERMRRIEGEASPGLFTRILDMMSTHPVTAERIAAVPPLPPGTAVRPALSPAQWRDLRAICA